MWAQEDHQPGCVWGRGPCKLSCPQRAAHQLRSGLAQGRPPVETSYGPRGCSGRGPGLPAVTKEKVCNGDCRPRGCAEGSCRDDRTHGAGPLQLGGARGLGERALNLMKFTCKIEIGGGFPGGSAVQNLPASTGDTGSIFSPGRSYILGMPQLPRLCFRAREP